MITAEQIIAYVVEHPGCTSKDIARSLGYTKQQVNKRGLVGTIPRYPGIYAIPQLNSINFKHFPKEHPTVDPYTMETTELSTSDALLALRSSGRDPAVLIYEISKLKERAAQVVTEHADEIKTLKDEVEDLRIERDEATAEVKFLTEHFASMGEDEPEIVERESCVICHDEFDLKNMVNLHHDWDSGELDECVRKFFLDYDMMIEPIPTTGTITSPEDFHDLCIFSDCECTAMYCVPCLGTLHRNSIEPTQCAVCRK